MIEVSMHSISNSSRCGRLPDRPLAGTERSPYVSVWVQDIGSTDLTLAYGGEADMRRPRNATPFDNFSAVWERPATDPGSRRSASHMSKRYCGPAARPVVALSKSARFYRIELSKARRSAEGAT